MKSRIVIAMTAASLGFSTTAYSEALLGVAPPGDNVAVSAKVIHDNFSRKV